MPHSLKRALWPLTLACFGLATLGQSSDARSQRAAYLVQAKADVNGDGRMDEVRIDDMGTITVHITGSKDAGAWTALAASGKLIGGDLLIDRKLDPTGRTLVVATSKLRTDAGRRHEETVILAWTPGKLTTLWRGPVGNTGQDGAKHIRVELSKFGLIKYASRAGVYRCDGETAHLDAQRYDFASGKFRTVRQAVRVPASPQTSVLHATSKPADPKTAAAAGFWFRPQSASSSSQANSAADLVAPLALSDQDEKTAWVESKGGFGRGEFVTLKASVGAVRVKALRFVLGHGAAPSEYNRPKRLALLLGKTQKYWIEFDKDPKGPQWVELPSPVPSDCISIVIDDVYPRSASKSNKGRTAISEIAVVSEEDLDPAAAGALLAERIAKGRGNADLKRLLVAWGPQAAPALLGAIKATKNNQARLRLRLALAKIPAGAEELVLGISTEGASSRQYKQLQAGLVSLNGSSVPALGAALIDGKLPVAASKRVIEVLQQISDPQARATLFAALGKGSQEQRTHLTRALALQPGNTMLLATAMLSTSREKRPPDLYRALSIAVSRLTQDDAIRPDMAKQLSDDLKAAAEAGPEMDYETHYQLLYAAARVGGSELTETLVRQLEVHPDKNNAQSLALYELRASALASALASTVVLRPEETPSPQVTQALQSALTHANPGVRLAVLGSLNTSSALVVARSQRLQSDAWPEVRRAIAAGLSQHCWSRPATESLMDATRKDKDVAVARTAISALLQCNTRGLFALLLELIDDKTRPTELRLYAARNAGGVANATQASEVLGRFKKARTRALTDRVNGKIASALTVSLADLGGSKAVDLLEDSALDPAVPNLQAAALTGLAKLCLPSSKPILRKLKRSSNPAVAAAARQAGGRCN